MEHCRVRVDCVVPCKWRLANKVARSLPNQLGKSSDLFRGSQLQDVIRANNGARIVCSLLQAVMGVGGLSDKPASSFFDVFDAHARCNGGFGLIMGANVRWLGSHLGRWVGLLPQCCHWGCLFPRTPCHDLLGHR